MNHFYTVTFSEEYARTFKIEMTKSTDIEPFLSDFLLTFNTVFIPIDNTMNNSEIKPFHLSLPRNRQTARPANPASPNQSSPINSNAVDLKKRLLSPKTIKPVKDNQNEIPISPTVSPQTAIEQVAEKVLPAPQQNPVNKPAPNTVTNTNINKEILNNLIKDDQYWLAPLTPSVVVRFSFKVVTNDQELTFELHGDTDSYPLMSAKMEGPSRADGIIFYLDGISKGESRYTPGNSSFFVGLDTGRGSQLSEACAAVYSPSFLSPTQPRVFDFLIPALKKIEGKSRMLPIEMGETSGLVTRLSQMSKHAIRLKTRIPPPSSGDSFDMTFNGKFKQSSLSNLILYHDSNSNKDLCSLGMISHNQYSLEISYPLSPVQGFMAAIAAAMPI